jgi:hypothetical protein
LSNQCFKKHGSYKRRHGAWITEFRANNFDFGVLSSEIGANNLDFGVPSSEVRANSFDIGVPNSEIGANNLDFGVLSSDFRVNSFDIGEKKSDFGENSSESTTHKLRWAAGGRFDRLILKGSKLKVNAATLFTPAPFP